MHIPLFLGLGFLVVSPARSATVYVDQSANLAGTGDSWPTAYRHLQDALLDPTLTYGDQIYLAAGTYRPDRDEAGRVTPARRTETFRLVSGVALYGGFPPGGGDFSQRDPNRYQTVFSGDIGQLDNHTDNTYHVLTGSAADPNTLLDGVAVTLGNADGPFPHSCGAGLFIDRGDPTFKHCSFFSLQADDGAAIYCDAGNPSFIDCSFLCNMAYTAGAVSNLNGARPRLSRCLFICNWALSRGGALYNRNSQVLISNCAFGSNRSVMNNGGALICEDSTLILNFCTFSHNTAFLGLALACDSLNQAHPSAVTITNSILWDGPGEIWNNDNSTIRVDFSNIYGGFPGSNNLDADPFFLDPNGPDDILGTADDNLRLHWSSPCLNAGDPCSLTAGQSDLDGLPRRRYGRVDLGAYETFPVAADFEPDEDVDLTDLTRLIDAWLTHSLAGPFDPICDLNIDGRIDLVDFSALAAHWLWSP